MREIYRARGYIEVMKNMVCVPCFILPVLVIIYVRFIQPLILRFVPTAWKTKLDAWLYPTCPLDLKKDKKNNVGSGCCATEAQEGNLTTTQENEETKKTE